jgi:ABC-type siderophore export system fused ATPase/permease subunit
MSRAIEETQLWQKNDCRKNAFETIERKQRWIKALIVGVGGGTFAAFAGLTMNGLALLDVFDRTPIFRKVGIWLLIAAFPLALLGAHALDKIAEIEREEKRDIIAGKQKSEVNATEQ